MSELEKKSNEVVEEEKIEAEKNVEKPELKEENKIVETNEGDKENKEESKEVTEKSEEKEESKDEKFPRRRGRMSEEEMIMEKLASWVPKTDLGKLVKAKKITNIDEILDNNKKILEEQIVDTLIKAKSELLFAGQSKGKFGGGKRRAWRQAQKKTKEGNVITFSSLIAVGDKNGHIGLGFGKAKETLPAREKAIRDAKKNIFKIKRGSGSFDGSCDKLHSIPFKVSGKCGSCSITLIPAPQGTGLVIGKEGKKILRLAGIEDVYSQSKGKTRTTLNYSKAIVNALRKLK